jgi:hypothetical protein
MSSIDSTSIPNSATTKYNTEDIVKKEARGSDGSHLGEIKEVSYDYVITEKGIIDKDRLYIPRNSIIHVDGVYVWFGMTEDESKQYKRD